MRPYGIVVFPEQGGVGVYALGRAENGYAARAHKDDEVAEGTGYSIATFYETEAGRDAEMEALLRKYPGVMFCPISLTTGKKTQPSPKSSEFTISNRGVLPA